MNRSLVLSVAAVAILGFGLQGCTKGQQNAAGNTADATASTTANAADATGNSMANAETSKPVSDAQDAMSGAVGATSAATLGSVNTPAFVSNAAQSDMYETEASKMAETKAKSPAIKSFAKRMIKDHGKSTAELKSIVNKDGMQSDLPTKLDDRRQGLIDNLKNENGASFDARYADQQKAAHKEALTLLKGYADHGDNADLKAFAVKTAPVVQGHLDMADKLEPMTDAEAKNSAAAQ